MQQFSTLILLVYILTLSSCQQRQQTSSTDSVDKWFEEKKWAGQLTMDADSSIDREEFHLQYHHNKALWDSAFVYMSETDFDALPNGEYALLGADLIAKVSTYQTVGQEAKDFESHERYADIQFVVNGKENIGLDKSHNLTVAVPYNEGKDIVYYQEKAGVDLLATRGKFFLFFPDDAHRMGLVADSVPSTVKKVVIKVRYNSSENL